LREDRAGIRPARVSDENDASTTTAVGWQVGVRGAREAQPPGEGEEFARAPPGRSERKRVGRAQQAAVRRTAPHAAPCRSDGTVKLVLALALPALAAPPAAPPPTEARPVTDVLHGESIVDHYRWLEGDEKGNVTPEVASWTDAQNAYTRQCAGQPPRTRPTREPPA
jgi:hypothetical protein